VKLALVTNFAPDRRPLSEYGYHLAHGLMQSRPGRTVVVVSGRHDGSANGERRVWDYGSPKLALQIPRFLEAERPDAVLINTHFTNWGGNLADFAGALVPLISRKLSVPVISLIHHLPQTINARAAGYRLTPLHWLAIEAACCALATSDVVCFPLQRDVDHFRRYNPHRTARVPLGLAGRPLWAPLPGDEGNILTFGNWGRSKDPSEVIRCLSSGKFVGSLVVAGGSSHTKQGFVERLRELYPSPRVTFTGYVPEVVVPSLFHWSHLVVLPYRENTGASSVLMQVCQYGRVPVLRRLPVFERMVQELGLAAHFYETEYELRDLLEDLLANKSRLTEEGAANLAAVRHLAMDRVGAFYWSILEECVDQRAEGGNTRDGVAQPHPGCHPVYPLHLG
jgi:glycosyltransferase involved in cell wall biosynthesis